MDDSSPTLAATVAATEAEFGHRWGVWLSDTGQWWATRRRALSSDELAAGCVPYLQGETPDELRQRIRDEEALISNRQEDRDA